jgi:transcriptional regulator with XRE-family HTH domain
MKIDRKKFYYHLIGADFKNVEEFAKESGIHRATLNPYINGERSIFTSIVQRIAETLGVHPLQISDEEALSAKKVANDD